MLSISFFLEICLSSCMETLSLLTCDCMTQQSVMLLATSHQLTQVHVALKTVFKFQTKGWISKQNVAGLVCEKAVTLTYLQESKHFQLCVLSIICMFSAVVDARSYLLHLFQVIQLKSFAAFLNIIFGINF